MAVAVIFAATFTATQKAQQAENELQTAKAQAAKAIAEAEGQAKANELKQRTLTRELIEYEAVQKWNGQPASAGDLGRHALHHAQVERRGRLLGSAAIWIAEGRGPNPLSLDCR